MDFEKPNINKESITPDFLQEQVRLDESKWDKKFKELINEKIKENREEESEKIEKSPEDLNEQAFKRYTEGLGLDENKLKDKKILDLGFGEGQFIKHLIEKGITSEAFGIDAKLNEAVIEDKFKAHFFKGNFEEDLPVKDVDYVVSVGAVSNGISGGEEVLNMETIIEKSLASLKENGEIRIYPIQEAAKATPLEGLRESQQKWSDLLSKISETQNMKFRVEPKNVRVTGHNNDIILESVLIMQSKKTEGEPVRGKGFTMANKNRAPSDSFSQSEPSVQFRPGESSEKKNREKEETTEKENERTKYFTEADSIEDMLGDMLETRDSYSETFKIKPSGELDGISRLDGKPPYILGFENNPEWLYQIAAEIEKKHPKYHFSFEKDPEGKWMKYTVSKDKLDKAK